jgi:hypothetical protein
LVGIYWWEIWTVQTCWFNISVGISLPPVISWGQLYLTRASHKNQEMNYHRNECYFLRTKNYRSFVIHPWLLVTGVFLCFNLKMQFLKTRTTLQDLLYVRMSTPGIAYPKTGLLNPQLAGKLHINLKWENILQCVPWQSWDRLPKQFWKFVAKMR